MKEKNTFTQLWFDISKNVVQELTKRNKEYFCEYVIVKSYLLFMKNISHLYKEIKIFFQISEMNYKIVTYNIF